MNNYDYVYTKVRRQFGKPCAFSHVNCVTVRNQVRDQGIRDAWMFQNPSLLNISIGPQKSSHSAGTVKIPTQSHGQTHVEGGWPKEIDPTEPQETTKWRKRMDKDPQFVSCTSSMCRSMKQLMEQNECIDLFETYFPNQVPDLQVNDFDSCTIGLYKIRDSSSNGVSCIDWRPDGGAERFLTCYGSLKYQHDQTCASPSLVWDVSRSIKPACELTPNWSLVVAKYYARNADLVAGGNVAGRVEFFDLRASTKATGCSKYESSHHDPVFDLSWIQSKTHSEVVSTSTDGQVIWWDLRNLSEPTEVCRLPPGYGGTCLEWQQEAGPTKYLVGTEEGICISLTKKPKKPTEIGGWFGADDHGGSLRHLGPVYSVKRNPFHPKYFLSVGDWSAKIWTEELKSPLVQTAPAAAQVTCGTWSPTRPGVFMLGRFDGVLDFYDYHYQMNQVSYSHRVVNEAISSVACAGKLVAVGDASGAVSLVQLCDDLSAPSTSSEKSNVGALLEREQRREKNLDAVRKMPKIVRNCAELNMAAQYKNQNTIDQQSYVARERDWLSANADQLVSDRELTVKLS